MPEMNRLFICEQSSPKNFSHPIKTHAFDETMLLTHRYFMNHLGSEGAVEELAA
jgi:hypothetical protein